MANPFSINVVTPAGASLIASATATNQIVFIGAKTATTAATDATDLAGKSLSFYDGASGSIDSCSATDSTAKIVARFGNTSGAAQIVKSACIIGKLASQSDADAVIVAAMSDDGSEIVLPSSASPTQIIRFPFNINIDVAGSASTVYGDGATLADLQRFVSMYKAGDPTSGESQSILGTKVFTGDVGIGGFLQVADFIRGNNGCGIDDGITINSGGLEISETGLTSDWEFKAVVSYNAVGPIITFNFPNYNGSGHAPEVMLIADTQSRIELTADSVDVSSALSASSLFALSGSFGTAGNTNGTLTVYGSASVSGALSAGTIATDELTSTDGTTTTRLDKTGFSTGDGTHSAGFGSNGTGSVSGTMYVGALDSSGSVSAPSGSISGELSVGGLSGLAPNSSVGPLVVPIGGIVGVLGKEGGYVNTISAGGSATFGASQVKTCKWNSSTNAWEEGEYIPAGTYVALTGFVYASGGSSGPVFFIRTA